MACCSSSCSPRRRRPSHPCLGRCTLPKHNCMTCRDKRPGPIPPCMGWRYNAKDSPEHQLRCGWRPGHISCSVLKIINEHNCKRCSPPCGEFPSPCPAPSCSSCNSRCKPYPCRSLPCRPPPCRSPCRPPPCRPIRCPSPSPCPPFPCGPAPCRPCGPVPCRQLTCGLCPPKCRPVCRPCPPRRPCPPCRPCPPRRCLPCRPKPCRPCPPCQPCPPAPCGGNKPMIRIVRHGGLYTICTKPSDLVTAPHSDTPLKYIINNVPDADDHSPGADGEKRKMHIEARYNDYHFEYTCSQASFVVDFAPPD